MDFAGEQSAHRHAVNPAGQPAFAPAFHAVRVACLVQPRVGRDEFGRYPRAFAPGSRRRATPHHLSKRAVHGDFKTPLRMTLSRLFETRNVSNSKIARGSGDHQLIGPTVQGKIPLRYAVRRRSVEKSPPTATSPAHRPARIRKG